MENRVCLNIDTRKGLYVIPFLDLKKLDCFTVGFENEEKLIDTLNKILDLSIDMEDIVSIYITGDRYKDTDNSSLSWIKYSGDNWNLDALRNGLSLYLRQDHRRIRKCDVRFVNTQGMIRFQAGNPISDNDINLAVKAFLTTGKDTYKKQRDMYFLIRDGGFVRGYKVPVVKTRVNKTDLSKMESYNDDFVQYLIELAGRGDEYLERAMEELSKVDLEDISRTLYKTEHGVIDSFRTTDEGDTFEDAYTLVEFTGMSIDELKALQSGSGQMTIDNGFKR